MRGARIHTHKKQHAHFTPLSLTFVGRVGFITARPAWNTWSWTASWAHAHTHTNPHPPFTAVCDAAPRPEELFYWMKVAEWHFRLAVRQRLWLVRTWDGGRDAQPTQTGERGGGKPRIIFICRLSGCFLFYTNTNNIRLCWPDEGKSMFTLDTITFKALFLERNGNFKCIPRLDERWHNTHVSPFACALVKKNIYIYFPIPNLVFLTLGCC